METNYDKELLHELKEVDINVTIHKNIDFFLNSISNNYPMGFSGIDWDMKKPLFYIDFETETNLFENLEGELSKILKICPELNSENLVFIGDNLTEFGYEISLNNFIKFKKNFLSIPQHIYMWFPKIKKCINITFENEIIFG